MGLILRKVEQKPMGQTHSCIGHWHYQNPGFGYYYIPDPSLAVRGPAKRELCDGVPKNRFVKRTRIMDGKARVIK